MAQFAPAGPILSSVAQVCIRRPTYPTNPIDSKVAIVRAFGAVIGKALRPLPEDRGLIQILVALHDTGIGHSDL